MSVMQVYLTQLLYFGWSKWLMLVRTDPHMIVKLNRKSLQMNGSNPTRIQT